jgi:hypothetical protein
MEADDDALRAYYERGIERVPELAGFGPHLIATGVRSGTAVS